MQFLRLDNGARYVPLASVTFLLNEAPARDFLMISVRTLDGQHVLGSETVRLDGNAAEATLSA